MLGVGILIALLMRFAGHYYVEGVGYATILDVLSGRLATIGMLLALPVLKLLATSLTLGSGASGGVFSPSLFMGATLGAAYGALLRAALPGLHVNPATFALAGMAGLVAGATGAALTAIIMIFEMTLDYGVILPLTIVAAVAYGVRRVLSIESIYTMKLVRRGHTMPQALQANAHLVRRISDLRLDAVLVLSNEASPPALQPPAGGAPPEHVVLVDSGDRIIGFIERSDLLQRIGNGEPRAALADVVRRDFVTISDDATLTDLLTRMASARASAAVVVSASGSPAREATAPIVGFVTQSAMAEALAAGLELFGD
jgi:CIC family chloride channel protein